MKRTAEYTLELLAAGEGCFFDDQKKKKKILELQLF